MASTGRWQGKPYEMDASASQAPDRGHDGDDALPYQQRDVNLGLNEARS